MLLGRASYGAFSKVWPDLTGVRRRQGHRCTPGYKAIPKYVVSTTLTDDDVVDN
jgi:hypothetical protein